jgi:NAD(P)-dependent dehydrogenase (short-subunit alcohol dehydrogenase family)
MAFEGRVAFITGGGSGMGRMAARKLAAAGAAVAAVDVNEAGLAETAAGQPGIHTWKLDVTDAAAVEHVIKEAESQLGPIDRVYNAAAIMPTARLMDQDTEEIQRVMAINYGGVVNVTKLALPGMLERGRGDFIQFASVAGWLPTLLLGAYNASKFAVVAFSEVLYHENRDRGVRFACVCPPPVATPLLDQAKGAWPKIFDELPPLPPEQVLEAIEKTLEKNSFWVYPNTNAKAAVRVRRWLPNLMWKRIHKIEGF